MSNVQMTNDQKKGILKSYINATERIADLNDEISDLKAKSKRTTTAISDMPKGSGGNDRSKIIDSYLDMIAELEKEIRYLREAKREVEFLISTIDDWGVERIMRLRYIQGMQWEEICVKVNYSWKWVHKLHNDGLNEIEWQ
ncbi:DUF1492 domain-containing protein [Eubacteriaceae bacterium ES2]|nr:DUF1492 domain-containing protein [Eubacteriaceae bacterium ES2]